MRINYFIAQPRFKGFVCYPESFGHYYNDPSHRETRAPGQFGFYNWHIVRSGTGYVKIGDDTITLHAGSGFLYGPGVEQIYYSDRENPWDIRWVHFQGEGINELLQGKRAQEVWTFSWKDAEGLDELWSELLSYGDSDLEKDEVRLSALLYEMIAELAYNTENLQLVSVNGQRNKIIAAADWIRLHSEELLTLELMAETAGYSVSHFSRQFHQLMGQTPIEFLTECRILHSKKLLVSTDLSIKDVSEKVGFSSSAYYIQRFRKFENMTPEQFRRLRRGYKISLP
jgi:AraC-like DNA-binding protein